MQEFSLNLPPLGVSIDLISCANLQPFVFDLKRIHKHGVEQNIKKTRQ